MKRKCAFICALLFSVSVITSSQQLYGKENKSDQEKNKENAAQLSQKDQERWSAIELFSKVMNLVEENYYTQVSVKDLLTGAIKGMMSVLDPHSHFLPKEMMSRLEEETNGQFGGLGVEVTVKDGSVLVVSVIDDSPALKAGVRAQDRIVRINGQRLQNADLEEVTTLLKGEIGDSVELGILRGTDPKVLALKMQRQVIKIKTVKSALLSDGHIYLRLAQFQKNAANDLRSAYQLHMKELEKKKKPLQGIILDLRSNPGGLLDEAVNVSSLFLREGEVVSTEGREKKERETRYVNNKYHLDLSTPMIVLINGGSASASEIVGGALQDHFRAVVMGGTSFGKGSVQSVMRLEGGHGLKLTIAEYLTPKKRKIQAVGIKPDIMMDQSDVAWIQQHTDSKKFIREEDLKNHLENKKKMRQEAAPGNMSTESSSDVVRFDRNYRPEHDFQVQMAMHFLNSSHIFKQVQSQGE